MYTFSFFGSSIFPAFLLKIILALFPPNAKELLITVSSFFSLGSLGLKSIFPAFSLRFSISSSEYPTVGGTMFSVSAFIENTASIEPAAPRQWPTIALVELTLRLSFFSSKIVWSERNSAISFLAVPVPCALM